MTVDCRVSQRDTFLSASATALPLCGAVIWTLFARDAPDTDASRSYRQDCAKRLECTQTHRISNETTAKKLILIADGCVTVASLPRDTPPNQIGCFGTSPHGAVAPFSRETPHAQSETSRLVLGRDERHPFPSAESDALECPASSPDNREHVLCCPVAFYRCSSARPAPRSSTTPRRGDQRRPTDRQSNTAC